MGIKHTHWLLGIAASSLLVNSLQASELDSVDDAIRLKDCGSLENGFGPFDYINEQHVREHLPVVERFHFNSNVENLKSGQDGGRPGGDLDYTLRAFPNHHRALYAMVRYQGEHGYSRVAPGARYTAECYLIRAARFQPADSTVRMLYGIYLGKLERKSEALSQYRKAVELAPHSAEAHYNLALTYYKLGQIDNSVYHAKHAYDLGYPLTGLRRKLEAAGVWSEG